ncbi:MAG: hypothetical protein HWN67_01750 [Candidatus Helarchaeota archaeon]|nr:hypothetical protein [Candidatus Helarchaeota archaeon]
MDEDKKEKRKRKRPFFLKRRPRSFPPKPPPPPRPDKFFEGPLKFLKSFDPLGITDIVQYVRNEKFLIEERYKNSRERLKHYIDSIVNFFDVDFFSDKLFIYIQNVLNKFLSKSFEIELDIGGVKKIVFELYPIRKLLSEHRRVIDVLSKY